MPSPTKPLQIGALIFPKMDQLDFTGPYGALSRLPDADIHILWKNTTPIADQRGLLLTPTTTLAEAPPLDVLVIPGGSGQQQLMEDEEVLAFIRSQSAHAQLIFTVCTGSLILGAAGLLKGVKATTHWASFHLLKYFGAIPVDERVVVDGKIISTAGVTSGIDGALQVIAVLRGNEAAQQIQLSLEYAPEPLFRSGTPATATPEIVANVRASMQSLTDARLATAQRIAEKLAISPVE